jgi:hypothetical protein
MAMVIGSCDDSGSVGGVDKKENDNHDDLCNADGGNDKHGYVGGYIDDNSDVDGGGDYSFN